jgi:potassium large conductance calcium-activated channel subfamily M alpha protein 1
LFLIEISVEFIEKTFSFLFEKFTQNYKMIPIGLYRAAKMKQNNKPYVFLKPPPDCYILPGD